MTTPASPANRAKKETEEVVDHAQFGGCIDVVVDLLGMRPQPSRSAAHSALVISWDRRPRFVIPTDTAAAAAASCLAYNRLRDRRTRLQRGVLGVALRAGAARVLRGERYEIDTSEGSVMALLFELLGRDDICVAVGLGNFDTVWKPTLQVMSLDGRPVAYVKVGWTPFTRTLVGNEAETLRAVEAAGSTELVAPGFLHHSIWRERTLVVVSPLPGDVRRIADDAQVPSPAVVRGLGVVPTTTAFGSSSWWQRLAASVRKGAGHGSDAALAAAVAMVEDRFGDTEMQTARCHGDWTPWNLATSPTRGLVAWDWEYSEPDAPVGLDELHSRFQVIRLLEGGSAAAAFAASSVGVDRLIAAVQPLMVAGRVQAALRAGCALDEGGAESLRDVPAAVEAALR